jgi:hypothetical protein
MVRRRHRIAMVLAMLAVVALSTTAAAQVQTGSILVRITDEQGAVLPGANLTISSPVLVGGQMTGVTDAGGAYRFPSLPAGDYTVRLELQGFQTVIREGIVVSVGQTTPLEMQLKLASVAETVTVTGESPVVDTTSANVNVTLDEQLLQQTPGGRDIWAVLEYKVPGLVMSRPDVGGTSGGLQGTYSARGTTSGQNSQFLNGVNVGDPAAIGAAGYYYDYDAFEEIQVSTGAHDISVPTSGVFLNMATKTGGNSWAGRATVAWEGEQTQSRNIDDELLAFGFRPNTNEVDYVSDVNVSGGGPIFRDKVRVFGSFRDWRVHVNVPVQFSQLVLDQTNITSGLINTTWQVSQNNRLTGFYSRQKYDKPNRLLNNASITVPESTVNEQDMFDVVQALWNSVLTQNMFVDARVGVNKILFPTYFNGTGQSLTDNTTGIITGTNPTEVIRNRDRYQVNATFQYYLDQALGGRHEFRWGFDHSHAVTRNETHRIDNVQLTWASATNTSQNVTFHHTPFKDASALDVTALFIQDSYSLRNLTVTGGVRWERLEGYLPEQDSPPSPRFPNLQRNFPEVRDIVLWHTAGPRISAVYDVTGDGKTAVKASAGRYYYILSTGGGGVGSVNLNANYSEQYRWNDLNGDLVFQEGEHEGTPVITSGTTTTIDPEFRRPYTDEYSGGIDRELIADFKLSAVFTYRRERYLQASANPDNPYATAPTTAVDPGLDGVVGTSDDGTYSFFQRTGSGNRTLITNEPTGVQSYKGLELTATKRFSNRWQMLAGYTLSKNRLDDVTLDPRGGTDTAPTSPNFLINANGNITNAAFADRPHQFKLTGMYLMPWDVAVSANFRSQSGPPVTRQISRALAIGGNQTINLEPLGATRLPTLNTLDLRGSKAFRFGRRELSVDVDVYNLTNANTVWQVRTLTPAISVRPGGDFNATPRTIPQFMSPTQVLAPRIIRFGAAYRF